MEYWVGPPNVFLVFRVLQGWIPHLWQSFCLFNFKLPVNSVYLKVVPFLEWGTGWKDSPGASLDFAYLFVEFLLPYMCELLYKNHKPFLSCIFKRELS